MRRALAASSALVLLGLVVRALAASPAPAHPPAPEPAPAMAPAMAAAMDHGPAGVACAHCHEDPHHGAGGDTCQKCHGTGSWSQVLFTLADHDKTRFPLTGQHTQVACKDCHLEHKLEGLPLTCDGCHVDRHRGKLGNQCETCHDTSGFKPVTKIVFDHAERTGFALIGPHANLKCEDCHQGDRGRAMRLVQDATCGTCHTPVHGNFGSDCAQCHKIDLLTFEGAKFDHRASTGFPLERRHSALGCPSCHPSGSDALGLTDRCQECHIEPHGGQLGTVCSDCHQPDRWKLVRFDHDRTWFPLRGRHFVAPCDSCHSGERWIGLTRECWDCHAADLKKAPPLAAHRQGLADCGDCHNSWSWTTPFRP